MEISSILLAEDDVDDYQFLVEAFQKVSPTYKITMVRNGLDCITFLKTQSSPDVIFLDLNIPIKNGLECLTFIKDNVVLADIPVVIYSTSHYIKHIDAAYKNGAHYYIIKPSNADTLTDILKIVMGRLADSLALPGKENFVVRIATTQES